MNRNKIAIIILLVLAPVAIWLAIKNGKSTLDKDLSDFAIKDTGLITKIFLADKHKKQVLLEKTKTGEWKVNGKYSARPDVMSNLLYTLVKLEVKSPVGKKAKENILRQLASNAIKIEVYEGEKLTKMYYVGTETNDQSGTYMLLADIESGENSASPFIMHIPGFDGYLTPRYLTDEVDWRDRTVFRYVPIEIRSVKVVYKDEPQYNYELVQPKANAFAIKTTEGKMLARFDTLQVKQYLSYFQQINFEAYVKNEAQAYKDSIIRSGEKVQLTVTGKDGKANLVKLYHMPAPKDQQNEKGEKMKYDPDRMYALVNDGKDFVMVQYYVFGKLLQTPGYFLPLEANNVKK